MLITTISSGLRERKKANRINIVAWESKLQSEGTWRSIESRES